MNADRVILGENAIFTTDCKTSGVNNNVLVCGTSGCGKTMSISEPRILESFHTNLVVTVTKRRIVEQYTPLLRRRGYQVLDINFIDPMASNVAFDPLYYVRTERDVTNLASCIVEADPRSKYVSDPYWNNAATSLLAAEIAYIQATEPAPTFAHVLALHDTLALIEGGKGPIQTTLDDRFERLKVHCPDHMAHTYWSSFRTLPRSTAGCVCGMLGTALNGMFTPELREMMAQKPTMDLQRLGREKTVLFLSTSPADTVLNRFINLFYAQVFKSLFECARSAPGDTLPIPVHIICDDFATGGKIPNFPEYISVFREKGISVTLLLQSESQLEDIYGPRGATTIINNCDSYVYMGGMDLQTVGSISRRVDLPMNEVLYMPVGREFVIRRGQRPMETSRYDIRSSQLYREAFPTNAPEEPCPTPAEEPQERRA